jgi:lipid A disaccharide synthetase
VILGWLVVVGASATLAAVRGAAVFRRVRMAEGQLQDQVEALQKGGLLTLASRTAELQRRVAALQEALDQLSRALTALRMLMAAWSAATRPARFVLKFLRR